MSKTKRVKLVAPWGDYPAGKELEPEMHLAMTLISAGLAVPVAELPETTEAEAPTEQAVRPAPKRKRKTK